MQNWVCTNSQPAAILALRLFGSQPAGGSIGTLPSWIRIAAAATGPSWARAPAPSVTLTASARPLSGAALAIRSAASHDTGGAISAVMTKRSEASFSFRVGIKLLFSNSCPVSSVGTVGARSHALSFFTLPWRGRVDCRAQRRQVGWGELSLRAQRSPHPGSHLATLDV